jgi:Holliday junction DNA helicase RuvA
MIARLKGTVDDLYGDSIIVDVNGVGYQVRVDLRTRGALEAGSETVLYIHTQVRQDAITLFGFATLVDRQVFEKLMSVNKVGSKIALAALTGMDSQTLILAIDNEDMAALNRIKGVGAVMARRIVMDLKGKMTGLLSFIPRTTARGPTVSDQLVLALAQLGYRRSEITTALVGLQAQGLQDASVSDRLSAALKILSGSE